jgi:catechol 2,3-dioxygenase-like lactoylglutathione lyase family enzyme
MWDRKTFYFGDNISVGVRDVSKAVAWYQEKLGLRLTSEDFDAFLGFSRDDEVGLALVAVPAGQTTVNIERHPMLFSKKLEACREDFASRGIRVGALQGDSGGNSFFQFQDLEGNVTEVCIEPRVTPLRRGDARNSNTGGLDQIPTNRRFFPRRTLEPA